MRPIPVAYVLLSLFACGSDSAESRLRNYFGIPATVSSDPSALSVAILNELKRGAPEPRVASFLKAHGVGGDSLSHYYPPTTSDTGLVRIEYDPHERNIVATSYVVRLVFDSSLKLAGVRVTRGLTGP